MQEGAEIAITSADFNQLLLEEGMSITADELIELTLKKLVLKCEVKAPNHAPLVQSKVAQRVTLLPTPSTPIVNKENTENRQLEQAAASAIIKGNTQYNRGDYSSAVKSYRSSLEIYSQIKSIKYYKILPLMIECERKQRHYKEMVNLYEELSLIYTGKL